MLKSSNGTKVALILHGITWAFLLGLLTLAFQIRFNDLEHLEASVQEVRQLLFDHIGN